VVPRRPRADGVGIPPPPIYALCTVTEVSELSFAPPWGGCTVVPRRPLADGSGMPPPPRYALCTVTEVTELSFPPLWAVALWFPGVPEPTGAV
jgi:hypothetical protein